MTNQRDGFIRISGGAHSFRASKVRSCRYPPPIPTTRIICRRQCGSCVRSRGARIGRSVAVAISNFPVVLTPFWPKPWKGAPRRPESLRSRKARRPPRCKPGGLRRLCVSRYAEQHSGLGRAQYAIDHSMHRITSLDLNVCDFGSCRVWLTGLVCPAVALATRNLARPGFS